ncbi:MAG: hypothetical protein WAU00_21175 [Caldilinea sp.]|nr:hypothetical protein [Caldilinea sp.]HRA65285.1 hypothetical protein [Caldilinea sp.]
MELMLASVDPIEIEQMRADGAVTTCQTLRVLQTMPAVDKSAGDG